MCFLENKKKVLQKKKNVFSKLKKNKNSENFISTLFENWIWRIIILKKVYEKLIFFNCFCFLD